MVGKLILVRWSAISGSPLKPFDLLIVGCKSGDSFYDYLPVLRWGVRLVVDPPKERLCGYLPSHVEVKISRRDYHLLMAGEAIPEPESVSEAFDLVRRELSKSLEHHETMARRLREMLKCE